MSKKKLWSTNLCLASILLFVISAPLIFTPQISRGATTPSTYQKSSVTVDTIAAGTKYETNLYVIKSGRPGPVVMIVGGVHGNETAGYKAAEQLKNTSIGKGTLLVLPHANQLAINAGRRYVNGQDLNRAFPSRGGTRSSNVLANNILKTMDDYNVDWVMDMHEGYDYSKSSSNSSVGQTLIYYPDTQTRSVARSIVSSLNSNISGTYKDFSLLQYPIGGSLACAAAKSFGANSFILETCSNVSLSTRINYQLKAANILLNSLGMK